MHAIHAPSAGSKALPPDRLRRIALICAGISILGFFLILSADAFYAGFNRDDLMNLHWAWTRGFKGNITDALLFFRYSPTNRPVGSLFYERIFFYWGLAPAPYRVVCFLALAANLGIAGLWARKLTGSTATGLLTALLLSFHGWLTQLYMHIGFCFDIFCFLFYYLAFWWYLRERFAGRFPGLGAGGIWALLFALAMGSKEMAVSLPVMILLWELLFHPPDWRRPRTWLRWVGHEGRIAVLGGLMVLAFIGGRLGAEHSLLTHEAYRPHIGLEKYLTFSSTHLRWLVYEARWTEPAAGRGAALAVLGVLAATSRVRALGLALLLIAVLPVAFISQRGLDSIYVALPGLALLLASFLVGVAESMTRRGLDERRAMALVLPGHICAACVGACTAPAAPRLHARRGGRD